MERREYLSKLKRFRDKKLIKVVTGIRRCGKSTLMEKYRDWLITQGVSSGRIVFMILKTSIAMSRNGYLIPR